MTFKTNKIIEVINFLSKSESCKLNSFCRKIKMTCMTFYIFKNRDILYFINRNRFFLSFTILE